MKNSKKLMTVALTLISSLGMSGCGETKTDWVNENVKKAVEEAVTLTRSELMQKAADELKGGKFAWIGTSSRAKKAAEPFKAELTKLNADCANATFDMQSDVDGKIYTRLIQDVRNGVVNFDGCLLQDGYQFSKYSEYFVNYVPKEWREASDTNKELNSEPFALQYNFKTWLYNNADGKNNIPDNCWDFLKKGVKIQTMSPNNENVNRDFLIMLTQDKVCDILKEAYDDPSNDAKDYINVDDYKSYGEKQKYAYAFIHGYLQNAVFHDDDGEALNAFDKKTAPGSHAWIVYSKMMKINETDDVSKKWITSPALGLNNTDGNTAVNQMKGITGFLYKHYLQVMPNTKLPYTTCAFINYLSTTPEGFAGWADDVGDYPTMPSIDKDRRKYGHGTLATEVNDQKYYDFTRDPNGENVFPVMNDPTGDWWVKNNAVVEDPAIIGAAYDKVNEFIEKEMAKK